MHYIGTLLFSENFIHHPWTKTLQIFILHSILILMMRADRMSLNRRSRNPAMVSTSPACRHGCCGLWSQPPRQSRCPPCSSPAGQTSRTCNRYTTHNVSALYLKFQVLVPGGHQPTTPGWPPPHWLLCPACSWNTPHSGRDSPPRAAPRYQSSDPCLLIGRHLAQPRRLRPHSCSARRASRRGRSWWAPAGGSGGGVGPGGGGGGAPPAFTGALALPQNWFQVSPVVKYCLHKGLQLRKRAQPSLHPVLQHSDLDTGDRYKWIFVTKKGRLTHLCRTTSPSLSKSITSPSSSLNPSTKPDTAQMKILLHIYWCCRRLTCEFVQLPRLWKPIVNPMDHLQH